MPQAVVTRRARDWLFAIAMTDKILRDMGRTVPDWAQDPDSREYIYWLKQTLHDMQPRSGEVTPAVKKLRRKTPARAGRVDLLDRFFLWTFLGSHPGKRRRSHR